MAASKGARTAATLVRELELKRFHAMARRLIAVDCIAFDTER